MNKLRTFLSLLGVMVGIFVISSVFVVVDSMEDNLLESFDMLDDDVLFIQKWPWTFGEDYPWWKYIQRREPSMKDCRELESRLTAASAVAFQMKGMHDIEAGDNMMQNVPLAAVSHNFNEVISLNLGVGRLFNVSESASGAPVVVIGSEVAKNLFGTEEAIGNKLKVKGVRLEVIGVLNKEGASIVSGGMDEFVMVPAVLGPKFFDRHNSEGNAILVKADEGSDLDALKNEIIQQFRSVRRVRPADADDFSVNQIDILTGMISSIFSQVEIGGWFIAIFAILVGCFSIANIMFVSVRERTRIIGIQKALGAKSIFILIQFLFESIALCVFGAILALLAIEFLILIINSAGLGIELRISVYRVCIAMSISVVSGLIAGIIPALTAANMPPVEAIRMN